MQRTHVESRADFARKTKAFRGRLSGRSIGRFFRRHIGRAVGEVVGDALAMLMGEAGAFRTKLAMYRIRAAVCELVGLESCLWLGVRTERYAYRKVQWVDPADIKYVKKEGLVPYIQSGPWDLDRRAFELHPTIVDIFINKKQYKQTRQYAYMCRLISEGKAAYWCRSLNDIDRYFEILHRACDEIRKGSYEVQPLQHPRAIHEPRQRYPNEIVVSIDRDGYLLHERGGSHRLSAAKVFGLKQVPVVFLRRHYLYAKRVGDWGVS